MRDTFTAIKQSVGMTLLMPVIMLMGLFFTGSIWEGEGHSVLEFIIPESSPAIKLIKAFFDYLGDDGHIYWQPIRGASGWSHEKLTIAATECYKMIAGLWYRLVYKLEMWPFPLGKLASDKVPHEDKQQVAENLCRCRPEHLEPGLARAVRETVGTAAELVGNLQLIRMIKAAFENCKCDNIPNENRFARQSQARRGTFGRAFNNDTVAAHHVNSEAAAWHNVRMTKFFKSRGPNAAPVSRSQSSNAWNNFQMKEGSTAGEPEETTRRLAREWASMSPEQRLLYAKTCDGADGVDDVDASKVAKDTLFRAGSGCNSCLKTSWKALCNVGAFLFLEISKKASRSLVKGYSFVF